MMALFLRPRMRLPEVSGLMGTRGVLLFFFFFFTWAGSSAGVELTELLVAVSAPLLLLRRSASRASAGPGSGRASRAGEGSGSRSESQGAHSGVLMSGCGGSADAWAAAGAAGAAGGAGEAMRRVRRAVLSALRLRRGAMAAAGGAWVDMDGGGRERVRTMAAVAVAAIKRHAAGRARGRAGQTTDAAGGDACEGRLPGAQHTWASGARREDGVRRCAWHTSEPSGGAPISAC